MPVRIVDEPGFRVAFEQSLAGSAVGAPVGDHLLQIGDEQVDGRREIGGAPVAVAAGAIGRVEVGIGPVASPGLGAVQVLAPEQELDRVVAGRDIGLDVAGLLQRA